MTIQEPSDSTATRDARSGDDAPTSVGLSPASFSAPDFVVLSAWLGHAPFAFWLVDALRPRRIVELGTHTGFSFFAFAQAVKTFGLDTGCYAVDTWCGDDHAGVYGDDVYHRVLDRVERHYPGFTRLLRSTFDEAREHFEDGSIDLLHIDGRHAYEDVRHDFESWFPKLSPRAVVLFHDIEARERDFGVWKFWAEARGTHPSFEFLHSHGLGVLSVGNDVPPRVAELFSADEREARSIRAAYARLGDAVVQREALDRALALANERASALSLADARIAAAHAESDRAGEELRELRSENDSLRRTVAEQTDGLEALAFAIREQNDQADRVKRSLHETEEDLVRARIELDTARGSLPWRVTTSVFRVTDKVPAPLRRTFATSKHLASKLAPRWVKSPRGRLVAEAAEISKSPLFDATWYLGTYGDVAESGFDPAIHYLQFGAAEGRDPSGRFSTKEYLAGNPDVAASGMNPLLHFIRHGRDENRRSATAIPAGTRGRGRPLLEIVSSGFPYLTPLPLYSVPTKTRRVNMVTDSINAGQLFGGVGTAIVFSALLAKRLGATLRIVTLTEPAHAENVGRMFAIHGVDWTGNVEFVFAGKQGDRGLVDVGDDEYFVTTSWWSTRRAIRSVAPERIFYILQEDERMFYPFGDVHLRVSETLADRKIRFVVNSHLLFDHLIAEGFDNIRDRGVCFEPSFSNSTYFLDEARPRDKYNFFFYARPNNDRNLFYRGIEVIAEATLRGVLDPREWNLHIVGKDLEEMSFPTGYDVSFHQNLDWSVYGELMRKMDLGLSLMYTPHPSYPPLDLVASGAIAVTNRHGRKVTLDGYSKNILCSDVDVDSLVDTLRSGVALAKDTNRRRANYLAQTLGRDWNASFAPVLDALVKG